MCMKALVLALGMVWTTNVSLSLAVGDDITFLGNPAHEFTLDEVVETVILFVDTNAPGPVHDGSNWTTAFRCLQDALTVAKYGDQIRVAQGIYKPDQGTGIIPGDRTATFQLINGVTLKGGYAGFGEPDPNARDFELYETILSGDFDGNDVEVNDPCDLLTEPTRAENSYHVVTGSGTDATAVLDGFTITGGNANSHWSYGHDSGGGMYINFGSPTVINCTFKGNFADHGGGLDNGHSCLAVINCTFTKNYADWRGGGMHNGAGSPTVNNCIFSENNSGDYGGGMYNFDSNTVLYNCMFRNNSSVREGGGMSNTRSANPVVMNCIFSGNSSVRGGGIYNFESGLMMTNCIVSGNKARWGGGMYLWAGLPTPVGPCYVKQTCNVTLTNCTLIANQAEDGRTLACGSCDGPSKVQIVNCILWDGVDEIRNYDGSTIKITYSDVWDGFPGEGNFEADPCFVDPGYWDAYGEWFDGDYHLLPDSPCINAGDPDHPYDPNETDSGGEPRVIGGRIDMGAYEYRPLIPAEARFLPRTINPASQGRWITCYIWFPEGYDVADINSNSILLEFFDKEIEPEQFWVNEEQQVAMARFSRSEVQAILTVGQNELTITGQLTGGSVFEGTDVVRVIDKDGGKPTK